MKQYLKHLIAFLVVAVILVTMCGFSSDDGEINSSAVEKLVGDYYSTIYDSFINLEIGDFSDIMDLSDVHAKNRITNIKNSILREKYAEDNNLSDAHFSRYNYSFVIDKITIADNNTLDVTVILTTDSNPLHVYPYLFNPGENYFIVSITSNGLKIIDHRFSFIEVFEEISDCEIEYNPAKTIEEFASSFDC